mmetsp:Transcript_6204/g.12232  ORF Transcript_6204/g.12232 Transcript_6204/m.12232 type:complete len:382 (-) Transcript_6204:371-1516(-)
MKDSENGESETGGPPLATIIYTSGTTSKPKGVEWTHAMLEKNIRNLVEAWRWTENDRIVNILPLHHVHGLVNIVSCALWTGAELEMNDRFSVDKVFRALSRTSKQGQPTLFMAVPTIYSRLIDYRSKLNAPEVVESFDQALRRMRLFVSGSAALPNSVFNKWKTFSGHDILERYGMTECGMILSQSIDGPRIPGIVGLPLPDVDLKLCDPQTGMVDSIQGEVRVRGPSIFQRYRNQNEETASAFDNEGYFLTGDIARHDAPDGGLRILGRISTDIIKCGGEKISALELEHTILDHPDIDEGCIIAVPDEDLGEIPALIVKLKQSACGEAQLDLKSISDWIAEHGKLPRAQFPRAFRLVTSLPRNAMGKVDKKLLVKPWETM